MENTNYYEHSKKEATKKKFEEKNKKRIISRPYVTLSAVKLKS